MKSHIAGLLSLWLSFQSIAEGSCVPPQPYLKAQATVNAANITGTVQFIQDTKESNVQIIAKFSGLTPGQHGYHIHANPVTTDCDSTGGHYNPKNMTHGAWNATARHIGDTQALIANANGEASYTYSDPLIKIDEVLGRAVVIHAKADDFGLGGDANSTKTGNAGARLVCANITLF